MLFLVNPIQDRFLFFLVDTLRLPYKLKLLCFIDLSKACLKLIYQISSNILKFLILVVSVLIVSQCN